MVDRSTDFMLNATAVISSDLHALIRHVIVSSAIPRGSLISVGSPASGNLSGVVAGPRVVLFDRSYTTDRATDPPAPGPIDGPFVLCPDSSVAVAVTVRAMDTFGEFRAGLATVPLAFKSPLFIPEWSAEFSSVGLVVRRRIVGARAVLGISQVVI